MKHIGILLHSLEGALLCYRTAAFAAMEKLEPHRHPTITMTGQSMHASMDYWETGNLPAIRDIMSHDIAALARAGADFFVLPDNTAHIALEEEGAALALPGLHIAEVVADEIQRRDWRKAALLGTNWTMEGPVYSRALSSRGIEKVIPKEKTRAELHRIIFEELCVGEHSDRSIDYYRSVIEELRREGCQCVILGCTEIPLIINDENSALPILDSTRMLARAASDVALGNRELPVWRGGPF